MHCKWSPKSLPGNKTDWIKNILRANHTNNQLMDTFRGGAVMTTHSEASPAWVVTSQVNNWKRWSKVVLFSRSQMILEPLLNMCIVDGNMFMLDSSLARTSEIKMSTLTTPRPDGCVWAILTMVWLVELNWLVLGSGRGFYCNHNSRIMLCTIKNQFSAIYERIGLTARLISEYLFSKADKCIFTATFRI